MAEDVTAPVSASKNGRGPQVEKHGAIMACVVDADAIGEDAEIGEAGGWFLITRALIASVVNRSLLVLLTSLYPFLPLRLAVYLRFRLFRIPNKVISDDRWGWRRANLDVKFMDALGDDWLKYHIRRGDANGYYNWITVKSKDGVLGHCLSNFPRNYDPEQRSEDHTGSGLIGRELGIPLYVLRAPILVVGLAILALAMPQQVLEVYRVMGENIANAPQGDFWEWIADASVIRGVMTLIALFAATFFTWFVSRHLTLQLAQHDLLTNGIRGRLLRRLPRYLAVALPLAAAWGMVRASGILTDTADLNAHWVLIYGAVGLAIFAVLFAIWTVMRKRGKAKAIKYLAARGERWVFAVGQGLFSLWGQLAIVGVILPCLALTALFPVQISQTIGTIGLFVLFVIGLLLVGSLAVAIAETKLGSDDAVSKGGFPILTVLVGFAFLFSWLDINDNHRIRTLAADASAPAPMSLEDAFSAWYDARTDKDAPAFKEYYPVYVISAQGGGLYAAHHAAGFLARMQDRCQNFAQHVFAISGVSGGAVGSALFASMVHGKPQVAEPQRCHLGEPVRPGLLETFTWDYMRGDFLAPLVASGLSSDFVQRFLPFPIESFDRARSLERMLEWQFNQSNASFPIPDAGENPLGKSFASLWHPDGTMPALLLNATDVDMGNRIVVSPFNLGRPTDFPKNTDIRLSTAAALSARFPIVTPAGWVKDGARKVRLVDGGYYENSGSATALDVVVRLDKLVEQQGLPVRIILVSLTSPPGSDLPGQQVDRGFGELMSPVRTMLNTRGARGIDAVLQAQEMLRELESGSADGSPGAMERMRIVKLDAVKLGVPLGWQLTDRSRRLILGSMGFPGRCTGQPVDAEDSDCIAKAVALELSPPN